MRFVIAMVLTMFLPATAQAAVHASDSPAYTGWSTVAFANDLSSTYFCIPFCEAASVPAFRWVDGTWQTTTVPTGTRMYAFPFSLPWVWAWTSRTGWLALRANYLLISAPDLSRVGVAGTPTNCGNQQQLVHDANDPEITNVNNVWYMFFDSNRDVYSDQYGAEIYAAAPANNQLSSTTWNVIKDANGKAVPLVARPRDTTYSIWDSKVIETPSFVQGYDATAQKWVTRIYYTGFAADWPTAARPYPTRDLMIGFAQWDDTRRGYVRYGDPVLRGSLPFEQFSISGPGYGKSWVGEPNVRYINSKWVMWYAAGYPNKLSYAESVDGINWINRHVVWNDSDIFDNDVRAVGNHFESVFGTLNSTGQVDGIWWQRSATAGPTSGDWTKWVHLLVPSAPRLSWYARTASYPSFTYEGPTLNVFFGAIADVGTNSIGRFTCTAGPQ